MQAAQSRDLREEKDLQAVSGRRNRFGDQSGSLNKSNVGVHTDESLVGKLVKINVEFHSGSFTVWKQLNPDGSVNQGTRLDLKAINFTDSICEIYRANEYYYTLYNLEHDCYLGLGKRSFTVLEG